MSDGARVFNRRPMAPAALALCSGILLSSGITGTRLIVAVCFFVLISILSAVFRQRTLLLVSLMLLAGLLRAHAEAMLGAPEISLPFFDNIRATLCGRTEELFGDAAPVLSAMLWGDKTGMDYAALTAFRTAGIAHVFALSGLHVSFFVAALAWALTRCSHRTRFIAVTAFLSVYCAVCAFPASLVRASIMSLCILGAPLAGRPGDTLSSLSFSAIVILLFSPSELTSAGFLMSFGAVYGIAIFARPLKRWLRPLGKEGAGSVAVSLSASAGVLPWTAYFFQRLPLFSLPANLLLLPIVPVAVLCGFIGVGVSFLLPVLAIPFAYAGGFCVRVLTDVSSMVASLPGASVEIAAISPLLCVFLYAVMLLVSRYTLASLRGRVYGIIAAATLCFILGLFL